MTKTLIYHHPRLMPGGEARSMEIFGKFMVWQCQGCGFWQGRENTKWEILRSTRAQLNYIGRLVLKCKRCNRSIKFRNERRGGIRVKHRVSNNAKEIELLVKEMNKRTQGGK